MALELAPRELGWTTSPNRPGKWAVATGTAQATHPKKKKKKRMHRPGTRDGLMRPVSPSRAAPRDQKLGNTVPIHPGPPYKGRGCRADRQQRLWALDWAQNYDDNKPLNRQPPPTGLRAAAAGNLPAAANIFGTRYPTQSTARGPRTSLGPASPGTRRELPSPLQFRTDHEQAGDSD